MPGHAASRSASQPATGVRCSKLSRIRSISRLRSQSTTASAADPPPSRMPTARAIAGATSAGSMTGASSTNAAPPENPARRSAAIWIARLVLPTPAGPHSVTSRTPLDPRSAPAAATSSARPTSARGCGNGSGPGPRAARCSDGLRAASWSRRRSASSTSSASARSIIVTRRGVLANPVSISLTVRVLRPARSASDSCESRATDRRRYSSSASDSGTTLDFARRA